jgi:hypothetical protein
MSAACHLRDLEVERYGTPTRAGDLVDSIRRGSILVNADIRWLGGGDKGPYRRTPAIN